MAYELLLREAEQQRINVYELPLKGGLKGLYHRDSICINRRLSRTSEKTCILAEELGHYHTSAGNILDQSDICNRKQELRARDWACRRLVPLDKVIEAFEAGARNRYELAEHLDVTEDFIEMALNYYRRKHERYTVIRNYIIFFDPLAVAKMIEH
ncbi:hypothetical protein J6TS7_44440 [Paenibacillus dendritiformis]|uniref:ImmA/IrrE family metallo-endopeptidase n=1 Tax=Paenibacillus TaxID=44249 RepID=UPI001B09FF16|nr:ImmA/IrrE family metallo-endopeptidase [Paenibacillus dendritiformis]GIO80834.1 hypothetical protein J6TS7_44440 [Paenibacillus dendritiformis]